MPVFVKQAKEPLTRFIQSIFFVGFALIAGCAQQAEDRHFELGPIETNWSNDQLSVTVHQKLTLSNEAKKALVHGVPLTVRLELLLRHPGQRKPLRTGVYSYEIRYLPLIGHYQLTRADTLDIRTFPRLRHLLAELSTVRQSFSVNDLPAGTYELMARTRLDQKKMPPPMRLPMLFSAQWRHDSEWKTWQVANGS